MCYLYVFVCWNQMKFFEVRYEIGNSLLDFGADSHQMQTWEFI